MENIKDKVCKLLQLAASDNVNEAALAMSMAQNLIDKYNLDMAEASENQDVKFEEIIEDKEPLFSGGRIPGWKSLLAAVIARHNNCRIVIFKGMGTTRERLTILKIYGRPSDIDNVRYIFAYALDQLTRLSYLPCIGEGHRFKDSWYHGAVSGISQKLGETKQDLFNSTTSKFAVRKYVQLGDEVDDFIKNKCGKLGKCRSNSHLDGNAFNNGQKVGRDINLSKRPSNAIGGRSTLSSS